MFRWRYAGSLSTSRQGAAITVLDGKPTIIGGFYDFDQYPVLAEQFDAELGKIVHINVYILENVS